MDQIRKAWRCIERWVDSESELPPVEEMFNPPATPAEIDAAERALGHPFPASYRASLLVHDGQIETGPTVTRRWAAADRPTRGNLLHVPRPGTRPGRRLGSGDLHQGRVLVFSGNAVRSATARAREC
jgi:hypothetical protein